jgi:hypothetical protein
MAARIRPVFGMLMPGAFVVVVGLRLGVMSRGREAVLFVLTEMTERRHGVAVARESVRHCKQWPDQRQALRQPGGGLLAAGLGHPLPHLPAIAGSQTELTL